MRTYNIGPFLLTRWAAWNTLPALTLRGPRWALTIGGLHWRAW